jgi:hypothetical protein
VFQRQLPRIENAPYRETKEPLEQETSTLVAKHYVLPQILVVLMPSELKKSDHSAPFYNGAIGKQWRKFYNRFLNKHYIN